jgi:hypothetical protein
MLYITSTPPRRAAADGAQVRQQQVFSRRLIQEEAEWGVQGMRYQLGLPEGRQRIAFRPERSCSGFTPAAAAASFTSRPTRSRAQRSIAGLMWAC